MKRHVVRASKIVGGVAFILLGIAGLFLPFLQGILFLVIGLSLLSTESERARRLLEKLKAWVRRNRRRQGAKDDG
jgi:uncharacterized membrane protein YbaN (DUF454 family)